MRQEVIIVLKNNYTCGVLRGPERKVILVLNGWLGTCQNQVAGGELVVEPSGTCKGNHAHKAVINWMEVETQKYAKAAVRFGNDRRRILDVLESVG